MGKADKAFLLKPEGPDGELAKSVQPDTTAAYGNYPALYTANCRGAIPAGV